MGRGDIGMRRAMHTMILAAALLLAACGGEGAAPEGNEGDGGDGAGATVSVMGTNDLAFEPAELSAPAGTITVELTAEDAVNHTFVVENADGDAEVAAADPGQTGTGTVDLESGSYTFYCDVPGHREAGMEGTLAVE